MKAELKQKKKELNDLISELKLKDDELKTLENKVLIQTASTDSDQSTSGGVLGWPTQGGYISSGMGTRWGKTHKGIDIARTDRSTSPPIYAAESGTVVSAGSQNGYGNTVVINHGNGMETLYAHMASIHVSS